MPAPAVSSTVVSGYTPPMAGAPVPYGAMGVPDGVTGVVGPRADEPEVHDGVAIGTLLDWFNAYQDTKTEEMEEQRTARRYYHGVQWTDDEEKVLADRKQPSITNNKIGPKIDGIVGVVVRLRQDPKAFARTQAHAAGAEIGTAALREVFDSSAWEALSAQIAQDMGIDGIGGVELHLEPNQDGQSAEICMRRVSPETFFYDPRSVQADFSDGRYRGVYKWMDLDAAIEMMPQFEEQLENAIDLTSGTSYGLEDWDKLWYDRRLKRVKIVECWYKLRGEWRSSIHTGDHVLSDVVSPFVDDKGKTFCPYLMASAGIDHLGNRYGFVRNMKSPQDEINHRRSKLLHIMNVNQVILEKGAVDSIDRAREELAKPDGIIEINPGGSGEHKFTIRDQSVQMQGQAELLAEAKQSIEGFGPTPALLGSGASSASGRAMQMQMQAGIAQLGPYFMRYKDWKLRVYRAVWSSVKQFWTNERFIRVAGEDPVQFLPINQMVMTPMGPRIANAIGQLDVDIVMDEGPDVVTLQEDVMQAVTAMITQRLIPPEAALPVVVELSNLPEATKKKLMGLGKPEPDPQVAAQQQQEAAMAKQLQVAGATAKIRKTNADADSAQADAMHKVAMAKDSGTLADMHVINTAKAVTDIQHKTAQIRKAHTEADAAHLSNLGTLGDGIAAGVQHGLIPHPMELNQHAQPDLTPYQTVPRIPAQQYQPGGY